MTTLLVPTDFSTCAKNAADYAVELAKILDAQVVLFFIDMFSPKADEDENKSRAAKNAAKLEALAKELEKELPGRVKSFSRSTNDHQSHEILKLAEEQKADIIIMGSKGRSAAVSMEIGSNTTAVIRNCNIPVIAVPAKYKFKPVDKIIVGLEDVDFLNKALATNLSVISEIFDANMTLLRIYELSTLKEESGTLSVDEKLQKLFNQDKTSFEFRFSKNVVEGLNKAAQKEKADLVVMMPHKTNWLGKIFHRSKTRRMALLLNKPLLVLPPDLNNSKWRKALKKQSV